jgi:membrane protease YdiL (CAAX protease family)
LLPDIFLISIHTYKHVFQEKTMNHDAAVSYPPATTKTMQPLGWGASLLYFGIPAAALFAAFHGLMPWLIAKGISFFYAFAFSLGLPLSGMLAAALIATRRERHSLNWANLQSRWRLQDMNGRSWLWTIVVLLIAFVAYGGLTAVQNSLAVQGLIPIPDGLPTFLDPRQDVGGDNISHAFGDIQGDWMVLVVYLALLFVNVVGEEAWWRGYILPRQELAFGRWTWVIHGVMWNLFHVFKWWDLIALLPVTLLLTFLVVRLRNNTPGLVFHALFNGLSLPFVIIAIIG